MLNLLNLVKNAVAAIKQTLNMDELSHIRTEYLGQKGHLTLKMKILRELPPEKRSAIGMMINQAKKQIQRELNKRKTELDDISLNIKLSTEIIDVSLPGRRIVNGNLHPIVRTINRIESFFTKLGFCIVIGPEIEIDYNNFDALNISNYHPTRTDQDTFWFNATLLLRTQTSCVQIRTMKSQQPPIHVLTSGRVYRNDYDKTHTPMFHQTEGLIIDQSISFANLKEMLCNFLRNFFENDLQIRFRPSYFPFTEPSAEFDVMDKNGKWMEILGCGMVHPNVLRNVGINPEIYSGCAFGMGIERLAMLRYEVTDLRMFFENDLRFLKQFK